ncbi:SRPBCC family protein [Amycolatopsis keratiniphila]|uniref:SRPBCC family protein n=1 Tax=Amycolatopsis keratiniphila TaxID=129921 RepID=UPI00087927BE|nr:SRPBCC family protein [Amycolatopsis keratiniphila]OLZ60698.1 cyclase [Amycolatopsis keratiniphila subsp. nogabecina]SDU66132.1 Polyketide cyclase / dehydrase and lipid transport [Amycolatopsis keratiniphila]
MSTITKAIEVEADVTTVYDQWARFVDLPRFVPGLDRVEQRDDVHTRWTISIGGLKRTFDATITEQRADKRISWEPRSGPGHSGTVTMHRINATRTRVTVDMTIAPAGFVENVADKLGFLDRHVQIALERFKSFIENRDSNA